VTSGRLRSSVASVTRASASRLGPTRSRAPRISERRVRQSFVSSSANRSRRLRGGSSTRPQSREISVVVGFGRVFLISRFFCRSIESQRDRALAPPRALLLRRTTPSHCGLPIGAPSYQTPAGVLAPTRQCAEAPLDARVSGRYGGHMITCVITLSHDHGVTRVVTLSGSCSI
jgi:hypothetical protein